MTTPEKSEHNTTGSSCFRMKMPWAQQSLTTALQLRSYENGRRGQHRLNDGEIQLKPIIRLPIVDLLLSACSLMEHEQTKHEMVDAAQILS